MMETFLSSRHYLGRCCFLLRLWTERVLQSLSKSVSADECKTSEVCKTFNERSGGNFRDVVRQADEVI